MKKAPPRGFLNFEHRLLDFIKRHELISSHWLLAISGGVDSMALLRSCLKLRQAAQLQLRVAHVHHGSGSPRQSEYRDRAWKWVKDQCELLDVEFVSNLRGLQRKSGRRIYDFSISPEQPLVSEEALRQFRYQCLRQWRGDDEWIVTAHNRNDLLETRLIRLIRGTGEEGLASFGEKSADCLRPLLSFSRQELRTYNQARGQKWVEDPTNKSVEPLRNWIRHRWLPLLDKKRPGSSLSLARSLDLLAQSRDFKPQEASLLPASEGISFSELKRLELEGQGRVLARYMRELGIRNYGQTHIDEVLKRLKSPRRRFQFELLEHIWTVDCDRISAVWKSERS